jgi:hypothetical protein
MRSVVLIAVDYETELKFSIPKDALAAIRGNVPVERFHKVASVLDAIINRLRK